MDEHPGGDSFSCRIQMVMKRKKKNKEKKEKLLLIVHYFLLFLSLTAVSILLFVLSSQTKELNVIVSELRGIQTVKESLVNESEITTFEIEQKSNKISNLSSSQKSLQDNLINLRKTFQNLLKNNSKLKSEKSHLNVLENSKIIKSLDDISIIKSFISKSLSKNEKNYSPIINILYQSYDTIDSIEIFSKKIINKKNIVLLFKSKSNSEEFIFGGFISEKICDCMDQEDPNAFLFSLSYKEMHEIKEGKAAYSLNPTKYFSFGKNDLFLMDNFISTESFSMFPDHYGDSKKALLSLVITDQNNYFYLDELEAFEFVDIDEN